MLVSKPANPPVPWLWTVRGMRTAGLRTPRQARPRTAVTARPRPPTGPSVGSGSASVETRPGARGVPETVTKGRSLPTSSSPRVARAALSSAGYILLALEDLRAASAYLRRPDSHADLSPHQ